MIIDIHTHSFPDKIAAKAISKLASAARSDNYLDGTDAALSASSKKYNIDYSVLQPVATSPAQTLSINKTAAIINLTSEDTHLLSFAGIHPANDDYQILLKNISENGFKGIKLHPVYQNVFIDSEEIIRLVDCANEHNLVTLFHAGYDIGIPGHEESCVKHILNFINSVDTSRVILAHMGGWNEWDDVEKYISGAPIFFDTAFSITPVRYKLSPGADQTERSQMTADQFVRLVRKHGCEKIIFGSDSPWANQGEAVSSIINSGLKTEEIALVLGNNAAKLLNLSKRSNLL